jgi:hypothetical protein
MSKRTPGPWVITHSPLNGYRVSDKTGWGVAVVLKDTNDEANARLIAAAPEMLEALEMADELIDQLVIDNTDNYAEERAKIRAAIATAKGEI